MYVASDNTEIRDVARAMRHAKLVVTERSAETCTDEASSESALLEFAEARTFERVFFIQATNPFLRSSDLSAALAHLGATGSDSLLSVTREYRFRWLEKTTRTVTPANYDPTMRPRRQDWPGELVENGAFYLTGRDALLRSKCRVSGVIAAWEMAACSGLEVDKAEDWAMIESVFRAKMRGGSKGVDAGDHDRA